MEYKKYLIYSLYAYVIYIFLFIIFISDSYSYEAVIFFEKCKYCLGFKELWINEIIPSFKYIFGAYILSNIYTLVDKKESSFRIFFFLILFLIVLHALNELI